MTQPRMKDSLQFNKSEANIGGLPNELHMSVQVESQTLSQWAKRLNPTDMQMKNQLLNGTPLVS